MNSRPSLFGDAEHKLNLQLAKAQQLSGWTRLERDLKNNFQTWRNPRWRSSVLWSSLSLWMTMSLVWASVSAFSSPTSPKWTLQRLERQRRFSSAAKELLELLLLLLFSICLISSLEGIQVKKISSFLGVNPGSSCLLVKRSINWAIATLIQQSWKKYV